MQDFFFFGFYLGSRNHEFVLGYFGWHVCLIHVKLLQLFHDLVLDVAMLHQLFNGDSLIFIFN